MLQGQKPERALGNVYVRENTLAKAGDKRAGHTHHFDHVTQFLRGRFKVTATLPDGRVQTREFTSPDYCLIRAEVTHAIEALTDDCLFWCVYAHRDPQGSVVQRYTGWEEAHQ